MQAYFGRTLSPFRQDFTALVGQAGEQAGGIYEADYRDFNRETYARGRADLRRHLRRLQAAAGRRLAPRRARPGRPARRSPPDGPPPPRPSAPSTDPSTVPRAEHSAPLRPADRSSPTAPIARVAAEAAGTAALQELSESVARARETGRMVLDLPLDAIAPDHLTRDRLPAEDEEMAALRASIRAHGQRTPIEVTPLSRAGALPYGLISGWRRLQALKALHAETGEARFATVQALVRRPDTAADAYVAMVEENEIRLGPQPLRARPGRGARHRPRRLPQREGGAARALRHRRRPKRSRIRAFLEIFHALDGTLRFPAHLPERLGLSARRARSAPAGATGSPRRSPPPIPQTPEAELAALAALVARPEPPRGGRRRDPAGRRARGAAQRPHADAEAEGQGRDARARRRGPRAARPPGRNGSALPGLRQRSSSWPG